MEVQDSHESSNNINQDLQVDTFGNVSSIIEMSHISMISGDFEGLT
jgi:hypothetical protein